MQSHRRTGAALVDACPELFQAQYPTALALRDEEGRLLGEGNAPRNVVATAEIEWRPSHYPGSRYRHPKPINVSALKQLTRCWDDLLALLASARAHFVRRYGIEASLCASELWRYSRFVVTIPNYLTNRRDDPVAPDRIPTIASVAFKSTAGIFIVTADMFFREVDLDAEFTPDDLVVYADDHGLFEGASGVCAGPPSKMTDLLAVVVTGPGAARSDPAVLADLVGDVDAFFDYARLYTKLEFTKQVAAFALQERMADLYRSVKRAPELHATALGAALVDGLDEAVGGHRLQRRLLDEEGLRKRLVTTLEGQLRELEWPGTPAGEPAASQETPAADHALRVDDVIAAADRARDAAHRRVVDLAAHALMDCVAIERDALRRLQAICSEINRLLGRAQSPVELGHEDVRRAVGPTPTDMIANRLGVAVEYDAETVSLRRS